MRFCVSGDFDKNEFLESLSLRAAGGEMILYSRGEWTVEIR